MKKELTRKEESIFTIPDVRYNKRPIRLKRSVFEKQILEEGEIKVADVIRGALRQISARLNRSTVIDRVLLVGGSSQIPYVRSLIIEQLKDAAISEKNIIISDECLKSIAKGAAIQAALRSGQDVPPFTHEHTCTSVVTRDILLKCEGTSPEPFVAHGTPYPFPGDIEHTVSIPHSLSPCVNFSLLEKDDQDLDHPIRVGQYDYFLPIFYTGQKIDVGINISQEGLYRVKIKHQATGEQADFTITKENAIQEHEITQHMEELSRYRDQSKK